MKLRALILLSTLAAGPALANPPKVATDIPAVHSLVAQVMDGVGAPDLIMRPGASPHAYAMRPSEAAALQGADLIFWIGEDLTPWLERALDKLGPEAVSIELLGVRGTKTLPIREGASFDAHDHGSEDHDGHDDDAKHDDHDHDDHVKHDEHDHDDHAKHDERDHDDHAKDHDHDEHDHDKHAHDHEGADPHAWLDPRNAGVWLGAIADALIKADPANATRYTANAEAAQARLEALEGRLDETLKPVQGRPFIVFHDAYQYFEARFGMTAAGAITLGDGFAPSAARIAEIRDRIADSGAECVFAEPQFDARTIETLIEGTEVRAAVLDPVGVELEFGPSFYEALLSRMADDLTACLAG